MMNKEYMMQQGGVSKATKMLNLSEDVPGSCWFGSLGPCQPSEISVVKDINDVS